MKTAEYYVVDVTEHVNEKVSEHFTISEFKCTDNSRVVVLNKALIDVLETIRKHFNKPVIINSGYRTVAYNSQLKNSSPKSQHTHGNAADIRIPGITPLALYNFINSFYRNSLGLGLYDTFVHVDVRDGKSRWDYRSKK